MVPCMSITIYTTKKDLAEGHVHKDYTGYDEVKNDPGFVRASRLENSLVMVMDG